MRDRLINIEKNYESIKYKEKEKMKNKPKDKKKKEKDISTILSTYETDENLDIIIYKN